MISNGKGNKAKYDANKVMVDKISIVDYVNNKIAKLQNDLTSFIPYTYGVNFNDVSKSLSATYQKLAMEDNIGSTFGTKNLYKINSDNIEYVGTNISDNNTCSLIYFQTNYYGTTLGSGENLKLFIEVLNSEGNQKAYSFATNTAIATSSRNELTCLLVTDLSAGDTINVQMSVDSTKTISINKTRMFIINQINLPTDYYDFIN